jgi:DNA-binding beta-propeller fold protein YncE
MTRAGSASGHRTLARAAIVVASAYVAVLVAWPLGALLTAMALELAGIAAPAASDRSLASSLAPPAVAAGGPLALFVRSIAWATGAATVGAVLAWPAARAFRRLPDSGARLLVALPLVLAMVLPPWLLFAATWISVGPGTSVGDAAARGGFVVELRTAALVAALVVWSIGPAFAVLVAARPREPVADERLLAIDGAGVFARARAALGRDARPLLLAVGAVAIFLLSETTVFDLALIPTYGFELRSLDALGAPPAEVLATAAPAIAAVVLALALLPALARRCGDDALRERGQAPATARVRVVFGVAVVGVPALLLVALFVRALVGAPHRGDFARLHGEAAVSSVAACAAAAAICAAFALSVRVLLADAAPIGRPIAKVAVALALGTSLLPGTVLALAFEAGFNHDATAFVYDSPLVLVLALAARTLGVGALVALLLAGREPRSAARLRALDAATAGAAWRTFRAEALAVLLVSLPVAFALALGELCASGRLVPPGMAWIATDILNAVHYQRPETVLLAAATLLVVALPAAFGVLWALRSRGPRAVGARMLLLVVLLAIPALPACGRSADAPAAEDEATTGPWSTAPKVARTLETSLSVGRPGRGPGQFNGPRVVAVDSRDGSFFVIDKDARVQRFDAAGTPVAEWSMPRSDRGKPVGASVAADGTLVVADTHEHRVVGYAPDGTLLWTLGEYGLGEGQFIYPTDIAFAPDGRMFVGEYGSNDRIQVFGPDRRFLYAFGREGVEPGELLRPQSLAYDAERDELYVADSANHRIQVFTGDGDFRRALSGPGREEGRLSYPFGVVLEIGGRPVPSATLLQPAHAPGARRTVVVAEHGNHRIQRFDAETGELLGVVGGLGAKPGRVKYPWALEAAGAGAGVARFAVCDHANSRIQFFELPAPD